MRLQISVRITFRSKVSCLPGQFFFYRCAFCAGPEQYISGLQLKDQISANASNHPQVFSEFSNLCKFNIPSYREKYKFQAKVWAFW